MWTTNIRQAAFLCALFGLSLSLGPAAFAQDQEPPADPIPLTEELVIEFEELQAVIEGLATLAEEGLRVKVVTDSQYVSRGMTEWLPNWIRIIWMPSCN